MAGDRLVRDVLLRDGSTLRLREPRPEDFDDIKAFYDDLSQESRYMRFHGYGRTDTAAREYAEAGGEDRVALIARHADRVVAAAGYDRLREPGAAEVAFAVADDFQGRGTATRLLEQLAAVGAERRINRFDAEVMAENRAMLGVFRRAGFEVRRKGALGEVTVSLDISPSEVVQNRIAERDHLGAVASLQAILAPSSLAVITSGELGGSVFENVLGYGFQGLAVPVDPAGGVVSSTGVTTSLAELEEAPELVIVAVPRSEVLEVATDAAAAGARALLVLASGLADDGSAPDGVEERLLEVVRGAGMRMVGPNSLGVLNTDPSVRLNASFAHARVAPGRLAICSQSGAIGIALLGHAAARRLGVSSFASLGNRADVSTNDLLELWEEDGRTSAVILYVETLGNPERFARIAQRVARRKPILAVKGHRGRAAMRGAEASHTAAALQGDAVVDALLHQAGVMRFRSGEELFNAAEFFEAQSLPRGRRVGILSNSAGIATLAIDACADGGLVVSRADAGNPLVLGMHAGPEEYGASARRLLADTGVDALIAYYVELSSGDAGGVLEAVSGASVDEAKPVVASVVSGDGRLPPSAPQTVPNYLFPEACVRVLARAAERRDWLSRPLGNRPRYDSVDGAAARELVAGCIERGGGGWLAAAEAEALIASHGIPVISSTACPDLESAVAAASRVACPVALKADFPPPAHASDIDAVLLGLEGEAAIRSGWRELEQRVRSAGRRWSGAVVQRLVPPGADVLVGAVADPDLGSVMALGLGGRQAGLERTAAFRLVPATDSEAGELIDSSEGVTHQLDGYRGQSPLDREALRELMLRFGLLLRAVPEIVEADLNPVRCMTKGCAVLDLRLRVERRRPLTRVKTW
ncbi:MAG: bifunctional GNAT family N-acetyltransferase/acetate--CoA ligase family protein [Thermoleophilaceae bacterium]